MKKSLTIAILTLASISLGAQQRQQSRNNPDMLVYQVTPTRTEIIIPEVNGYKVVKADLHVHSCYSDGNLTPGYRVTEAWQDGLDAMAMTDHIEYRPNEKKMVKFLADGVTVNEHEKGKVYSDLNFTVREAQAAAKKLGLTIIPGAEITRNANTTGHFNCLFTTDNNLIPDPDALQAVRNAKKQGAIVQSNHPGWRNPSNEFTPVAKEAFKEGLIDGVEVFNGQEFYPDVIEQAVRKNIYICAGSDIHLSTAEKFGKYKVFRDMTLILAKDASPESIREALEHQRTLAYSYGDIAGSEQMLKDFFASSVKFEVVYTDEKGGKQVKITNCSSFPYVITLPGTAVDNVLRGLSSIMFKFSKDELPVTVQNMWFGAGKHPELKVSL